MALIKEVDFIPLDKLVVTFDKYRTYSTEYTVLDNDKNAGKDPLKDEMETKVVKKKVKYNHQVGVIVATPNGEGEFIGGDQVLVDFRSCMALDGYKDLYIVAKYNIIGKIIDCESESLPIKKGDIFTIEKDPTEYKYLGNDKALKII